MVSSLTDAVDWEVLDWERTVFTEFGSYTSSHEEEFPTSLPFQNRLPMIIAKPNLTSD